MSQWEPFGQPGDSAHDDPAGSDERVDGVKPPDVVDAAVASETVASETEASETEASETEASETDVRALDHVAEDDAPGWRDGDTAPQGADSDQDGPAVVATADAQRQHVDRASDASADSRVDSLDDGAAAVGSSQALPFVLTTREHFEVLDAVVATGDARVDAATARLAEVPDLPTSDHVEIYDDVHRRLQDALSDTEVR